MRMVIRMITITVIIITVIIITVAMGMVMRVWSSG